jgi:hypothetical protein
MKSGATRTAFDALRHRALSEIIRDPVSQAIAPANGGKVVIK